MAYFLKVLDVRKLEVKLYTGGVFDGRDVLIGIVFEGELDLLSYGPEPNMGSCRVEEVFIVFVIEFLNC